MVSSCSPCYQERCPVREWEPQSLVMRAFLLEANASWRDARFTACFSRAREYCCIRALFGLMLTQSGSGEPEGKIKVFDGSFRVAVFI